MKKILVAFDGTEPSKRGLDMAADLAHAFGASVSVISVIPVHPGRVPIDPWDGRAEHAHELLEARRLLRERGVEADVIEGAGDVPREIEAVAEDGGFDTVILGSRGLNGIQRVLQGSVSQHVATHARATVVVAR